MEPRVRGKGRKSGEAIPFHPSWKELSGRGKSDPSQPGRGDGNPSDLLCLPAGEGDGKEGRKGIFLHGRRQRGISTQEDGKVRL